MTRGFWLGQRGLRARGRRPFVGLTGLKRTWFWERMNRKRLPKRTPGGEVMTSVVLAIFRANGRLLTAGDDLGRDLGLTSTRWQVMGGMLDRPRTVAQIARNFELTRQGVLWVVQALEKAGHVELIPNPDHRTAKLVRMTPKGKEIYDRISERQVRWVNSLAKTFDVAETQTAEKVLMALWAALGEAGQSKTARGGSRSEPPHPASTSNAAS